MKSLFGGKNRFDQAGWANALEQAGVGVHVTSPWCEVDDLVAALSAVLGDVPSIPLKAKELAYTLRNEESRGVEQACDFILSPLYSDLTTAGDAMVQRSCLHTRTRKKDDE